MKNLSVEREGVLQILDKKSRFRYVLKFYINNCNHEKKTLFKSLLYLGNK